MGPISDRADRFVRQVYRNKKRGPEEDPAKSQKIAARRERLVKARKQAVRDRKGY